MTRRVHGDRHPLVADDWSTSARCSSSAARYAEAERCYREALAITRGWYGANHYRPRPTSRCSAARSSTRSASTKPVGTCSERSPCRSACTAPVHPRVASAVNELGTSRWRASARRGGGGVLAHGRDLPRGVRESTILIGIAMSNLGSVATARKDYARAEGAYREAIALFAETQPPTHLNVGIARIKLGRALLRQGRLAEAEPESSRGWNPAKADEPVGRLGEERARRSRWRLYEATESRTGSRRASCRARGHSKVSLETTGRREGLPT